jgi:hypothetical protein
MTRWCELEGRIARRFFTWADAMPDDPHFLPVGWKARRAHDRQDLRPSDQ